MNSFTSITLPTKAKNPTFSSLTRFAKASRPGRPVSYIAGPVELVDSCKEALAELGVVRSDIVTSNIILALDSK